MYSMYTFALFCSPNYFLGAKLCRSSDLEPPLPLLYFFFTIFRNSAMITPASHNRKLHHPAMDSLVFPLHRCGIAVAVLARPVSSTAVSLKFENVVPGGLIFSFSYCSRSEGCAAVPMGSTLTHEFFFFFLILRRMG